MATLQALLDLVKTDKCNFCGARFNVTPNRLHSYAHEDGWKVDGKLQPQWLYFKCPGCNHQWSLNHLGVPRQSELNKSEDIHVPVKKGDIINVGKFKNKKIKVKKFGKDDHNMPTINGRVATTFRLTDDSKSINEDHDSEVPDGQPRDHFYVPSVMVDRDVIFNLLDKFTKAGISSTIQDKTLLITIVTYTTQAQLAALEDLRWQLADVIKFLKDEYKNTTGKSLGIASKPDHETYDCTANYTTAKQTLCKLTQGYELPEPKAESDASSKKAEIRGNVPAPIRAK